MHRSHSWLCRVSINRLLLLSLSFTKFFWLCPFDFILSSCGVLLKHQIFHINYSALVNYRGSWAVYLPLRQVELLFLSANHDMVINRSFDILNLVINLVDFTYVELFRLIELFWQILHPTYPNSWYYRNYQNNYYSCNYNRVDCVCLHPWHNIHEENKDSRFLCTSKFDCFYTYCGSSR